MPAATYTFNQFQQDYPNDEACLDKIMELRYGKEPICPACQRKAKYHRISKRRAYACQFCGEHVYPCVGTIFEKSTTPLSKWFFAMYLFTTTGHHEKLGSFPLRDVVLPWENQSWSGIA